jgi:hypothetical protein
MPLKRQARSCAGQPLFEAVHPCCWNALQFAGIKNQISIPRSLRPELAHCMYLRA